MINNIRTEITIIFYQLFIKIDKIFKIDLETSPSLVAINGNYLKFDLRVTPTIFSYKSSGQIKDIGVDNKDN